MFDETTIQSLIDSIGWDDPLGTSLVITTENLKSTTGRLFNSFHPLVTVENVNDTAGLKPIDIDQLNTELYGFKKQAALQTLNKVFNSSPQFNPALDYGGDVVKYNGLLSDVYGLACSAMVIQMMLTSMRINEIERRTKYGVLKVELDGFRNDQGVLISKGLKAMLNEATINARKIIFPETIDMYGDNLW